MSTREFWYEEPELLWAYRKSYIEKIKVERDMQNFTSWLNGLYVFDALSKCLYNSFGRKETQPILNYLEEPIDFNKKPKDEKEKIKEERLKVEEQIKERNRQIREMLKRKK